MNTWRCVNLIVVNLPIVTTCHSEERSDEESGVGPFRPSPDASRNLS